MLIDIQAHYLDLLVQVLEEANHACLLRSQGPSAGRIYVTPSPTDTRALFVITFDFDEVGARFGVSFNDGRVLSHAVTYIEGLAPFLSSLMRAFQAHRIEDKRAA